MLENRNDRSLATERGLWGDAYRELLKPRTVAVALASVALFAVAMTIFGPLGTLETLEPLPRFAYWSLSAAVTFPLCYALAAVVLYLTRRRSLIEIVPAVVAAVLLEGMLCAAVLLAADLLFVPAHVSPLSPLSTYLTATVVVAVCTFFAHYVVFLRIDHGRIAAAGRRSAAGAAAPAARRGSVPAAADGSDPAPAGSGPPPSPRARPAPPASDRAAAREQLTPQQARFYRRLPRAVGRDIIFLKVDDHYVDVHTGAGSCLVLMRFADAVTDLGALGMQVHRSYWVAYRHMLATVRRDRRTMLRVTGGRVVPISRPYLPAVRAAVRAPPSRPARGEQNA